MAQLRVHFEQRRKVKTVPWAGVPPMGDGIQLTLCIPRQIGTLGQILAQQAIDILVGPALLGARLSNGYYGTTSRIGRSWHPILTDLSSRSSQFQHVVDTAD